MKHGFKKKLFALLGLSAVMLFTGCGDILTPYDTNNADNYTVSVRYDANGGTFTTNTYSIVDSYNVSEMAKNSDGMAEIALISPDNTARGKDAFTAVNNGYFLAGWYKGRTESTDSLGNAVYSYSEKWDFDKDLLEVDPNKTYTSDQPVLTLYAAWVPLFEIEFYSLGSNRLIESLEFDPTATESISVPEWNKETGRIEMFRFPEKEGFTFAKAYYDSEGAMPVDTETVMHPGKVNYENGTAVDSVLKLYLDWTEGEWFRIYTAEQFADNAALSGHYEICADLDFAEEIWPTSIMYGNFSGEIKGNGYTLKNINAVQTNNSKANAGLFGQITESASISDITFENASFTIEAGTRVTGTCYGLLAGSISKDAELESVRILGGKLLIDSGCYFGADDYAIGLVCGMGDASVIETAEIECIATGDAPENLNITVDGNTVTVKTAE